jgi:hypothetical protein
MADISAGLRTYVLLRTLDVRQIRREVLEKRKASGMKSNVVILHTGDRHAKSRCCFLAYLE